MAISRLRGDIVDKKQRDMAKGGILKGREAARQFLLGLTEDSSCPMRTMHDDIRSKLDEVNARIPADTTKGEDYIMENSPTFVCGFRMGLFCVEASTGRVLDILGSEACDPDVFWASTGQCYPDNDRGCVVPLRAHGVTEYFPIPLAEIFGMKISEIFKSGTSVSREAYNPTRGLLFLDGSVRVINTYRPARSESSYISLNKEDDKAEHHKVIRDFFQFFIPEHGREMMQWLAWIAQNPGKRVKWSPVLFGDQGTGKSTVSLIIRAAMGSHNVRNLDSSVLVSNFNSILMGCLVGCFEEFTPATQEKARQRSALKSLITDPTLNITRKGCETFQIENVASYVFCTNDIDQFGMAAEDRRYFPIKTVARPVALKNREIYSKVYDIIENHPVSVESFFREMMIESDFSRDEAPISKFKDEAVSEGHSSIVLFMMDRLSKEPNPNEITGTKARQLWEAVCNTLYKPEQNNSVRMGKAMRSLGYTTEKSWNGTEAKTQITYTKA
jgi:hypothetical protein